MPTIPTYDGNKVRDSALQPIYRNTPDVSSGSRAIGQGLNQLGEGLDRLAERQAADEASALELRIRKDWYDADAELRTKYRGATTAGYRPAAEAWWQEARTKYAQGASPRALKMADRSIGVFEAQAIGSGIEYATRETERHGAEQFGAVTAATIEGATPASADASAAALQDQVARYGAGRAWSTEQVQGETLKLTSQMHALNAARLIDSNPVAASDYLTKHAAQIDKRTAERLRPAIERASHVVAAQEFADDAQQRGLTLDAALAEAGAKLSGDAESLAKAELRARYADEQRATADFQRKAYGTALLQVEQTGRVSPATFASLDDGNKAAVLNRIQAEAKAKQIAARGQSVKTDYGVYLQLRELAATDPEKFAQTDLRAYVDKIGPAQLEQLADIKSRFAKPVGQRDVATLIQQMNATADSLKIKDKAKRGEFIAYVTTAVDEAQTAKGRPLSFTERQAIIDQAVLNGPDPDAWLWGDKRYFQLDPEQRKDWKPYEGQQPAPAAAPVQIKDAADYAKLPSGAVFIDPQGVQRIKP